MRTKRKNAIVRLLTLMGALIIVSIVYPAVFAETARAAQVSARLNIIAGDAQIMEKGSKNWTPAKDGTSLNEGDSVKTLDKSRAEIVFFEGSVTRLGPSTEVTIEKTAQAGDNQNSRDISLKVILGRTWHRVKKMFSSESRYEVKTATAVATARGTTFRVDVDVTGKSICYIVDGSVDVASMDGKVVNLENGDKITVAPGASVTKEMIQKILAGDIDDFYLWNMETNDGGSGLLDPSSSTPVSPAAGTTSPDTTPVAGFTVTITGPINGAHLNSRPIQLVAVANESSITSASFDINGNTVDANIIDGGKFFKTVYLDVGINVITATAMNENGDTGSDTVYVTVENVITTLRVELDNGGKALYSHLIAPGGEWESAADCYRYNANPDWGYPGESQNPKDEGGYYNESHIENITLPQPASGTYEFYIEDGSITPIVSATVNVYLDEWLQATYVKNLAAGEVWHVCDINFPAGTVNEYSSSVVIIDKATPAGDATASLQEESASEETEAAPAVSDSVATTVPDNAAATVPDGAVTPAP